ncbi:hypothetical protein PBI_SCTP2_68 [Salicola phage SCTP-2]|nr:hypothetical protein PBI_SCTP2_68 [Salicola phage SCTP-2]
MATERKMRKYMDLIKESSEDYQKIIDNNEGRFGEPALNIDGEEIENSVYLGDGMIAYKEHNGVVIYHYDPANNEKKHMFLTHKSFEILKHKL